MTAKEFGTKGPRSIYPEICDSTSLGRCSVLANALWPRIIVSCDDQGRMAGSAADVLGECFPKMLAKVTIKAVEQSLGELAKARAIIRYKVNGEEYLQVRSWWAWQQYARRAYPSRMPAPEGWSDYVYGRVGDTFATWRDAAGLAARQGRGSHVENLYDDDLPSPTEWPEPQDLDDANRTLTASEPQPNRTLPLGGDYLSPLARAGSRPVPSRPVPYDPTRASFGGPGDELATLLATWKIRGFPLVTKLVSDLDALVEDYGDPAVRDQFERLHKDTTIKSAEQFIWGASKALRRIPKAPKEPTVEPDWNAAEKLRQRHHAQRPDW
jgi:hypothetical protein